MDSVLWNGLIECRIHGLVQDCSNSIALAMELLQSCTKTLIWLRQEDKTANIKDTIRWVTSRTLWNIVCFHGHYPVYILHMIMLYCNHNPVTMIVAADGLAPISHQIICNHYDDLDHTRGALAIHYVEGKFSGNIQYRCPMTSEALTAAVHFPCRCNATEQHWVYTMI